MCKNTSNCNIYLTYYCHICASNKYTPQIPHICHIYKLDHVHITQLCQFKYPKCTHQNQQCDHEQWYTHISHYWHMPLKKYVCHIIYIYVCVSHCTTTIVYIEISHTNQKTTNDNFILPCYSHVCASNKYALLMPAIYTPHVQITQYASLGEVSQYICNKWTHWHQSSDEEYCT